MPKTIISIIMGSNSDLEQMNSCCELLDKFEVSYELRILSAHRSPRRLINYVQNAAKRGINIFIAAAGGAAALAGVVAAHSTKPVIGVPIETKSLKGIDSLLSTVQMPSGVPVACMAIGKSGAKNAAVVALQIIAISDKKIAKKLSNYKRELAKLVKTK